MYRAANAPSLVRPDGQGADRVNSPPALSQLCHWNSSYGRRSLAGLAMAHPMSAIIRAETATRIVPTIVTSTDQLEPRFR
jgi:hypothetical protein